MTFEEVGQKYTMLRGEFESGRMTSAQFTMAINELRVLDESGVWWQLSEDGHWLSWNGTTWVSQQTQTRENVQHHQVNSSNQWTQPHPSSQHNQGNQGARDSTQEAMDDFRRVAQGLQQNTTLLQVQRYANNPASFLNQFRNVPLMKRPQIWWDTLSIFGGVTGGVLWFLYSSIRGMREGFDWMTVIIMVGLPVFLALFRGPLDKLLAPVQQYRNRIPRLVLVGVGLALPFLVANITYGMFIQYTYLHVNLIVGTLLSYLVFRNPAQ